MRKFEPCHVRFCPILNKDDIFVKILSQSSCSSKPTCYLTELLLYIYEAIQLTVLLITVNCLETHQSSIQKVDQQCALCSSSSLRNSSLLTLSFEIFYKNPFLSETTNSPVTNFCVLQQYHIIYVFGKNQDLKRLS